MIKKCMVLLYVLSTVLLAGCDNYQTGYRDSYANRQSNHWLIKDRSGYIAGYQAGQADYFQMKWEAENTDDDDKLQCRDIIVQADPLMFLPRGTREISPGVYSLEQ